MHYFTVNRIDRRRPLLQLQLEAALFTPLSFEIHTSARYEGTG
jgi:hypothetical protein